MLCCVFFGWKNAIFSQGGFFLMRKAMLLCALLLAVVLLAGCSADGGTTYPEANTAVQRDPMALATQAPAAAPEAEYDPASEEDDGSFLSGAVYNEYGQALYAGATPIPLDPIDMPTATPRPSLTFTYGQVDIPAMRLSFEAPAGWTADTSVADQVVLRDPNTYDNYNATMTVKLSPVASSYKLSDVRTTVQDELKQIGQYNYSEWTTTTLSARTLLRKDGYYANYRGVLYDGTVVRGRVMVALLDNNQIITVHMSCPGWYNESYMNVVAHFRETLKMQ